MKEPWKKLKLTEQSYLIAYTQGYRGAFQKPNTTYETGTSLRKAYDKGRRDAKKY